MKQPPRPQLAAEAAVSSPERFARHCRNPLARLERDEGIERNRRQRRDTYLTITTQRDGMYRVNGLLHPELGEQINKTIDLEVARLAADNPDQLDRGQLGAVALGNLLAGGHQAARPVEAEVLVITDHMTLTHDHTVEPVSPRSVFRSLWRGFRGRCPHCGEGRLFRAFLKPVAACAACGEDMSHQRADDAPPYFTMVIVGHLLVPLMLAVMLLTDLPVAVNLAIWLPFTLIATIALLQPVKGAIIGLQWALRMHGFDGSTDPDAAPEGFLAGPGT